MITSILDGILDEELSMGGSTLAIFNFNHLFQKIK